MSVHSAQAPVVQKGLEGKETTRNEETRKNSDEDELDDDEFEVDRILNVAAVDGEVKYQVRWKGYGSDEDSWEPEGNLKTARLILDEYIANHQDEVKNAHNTVLARSHLRKRCGKPKRLQNKEKMRSRRGCVENCEKALMKDESRYQAANVKRKTARNKGTKLLLKNLSRKRAKSSWLYDDTEDTDSDVSEGRVEADIFPRKIKKNNQSENATKKSSVSLAAAGKECGNSSEEKAINEEKQQKKESHPEVDVREQGYEPKVEFIGVVQCNDGAIKVIYAKKDEKLPRVVSVKEAFEIDGFGLVQYFISRCEFSVPKSSNL